LQKEITIGLQNLDIVEGVEYKQYILYAMFDYMCEMEPYMYGLGKKFGCVVQAKIKELKHERPNDVQFVIKMDEYADALRDYFNWSSYSSCV
jgi:hypothetical protein